MIEVRRKVLVIALGLLIIIMAFTGFLNYMTFADNYNNSLVNTYAVTGHESVRKIEYALHYGKPIDNYYGMNDTLQELKDIIPELDQVNIISPTGDILYDLNGFVRNRRLPDELLKVAVFEQGLVNENLSYQFYKENAYLFMRIDDNTAHHVASLVMVFPQNTFLQFNSYITRQLISYLIGIVIVALSLLVIIFFRSKLFTQDQLINKKKILIALIVVIGSAQLFYGGINYFLFKNAYLDMANTSKDFIQVIVGKNIESVYNKGLSLQNIEGLDKYLDSIKDSLPQIEDISIIPSKDLIAPNILSPGTVNVTISKGYIDKQMFNIFLDMVTMLIISILFMIEITLLAVIIMIRGPNQVAAKRIGVDTKTSHGLVRSLIFFVNLGAFMSLTFVPIVMKNLYQPIGELPKDVVLGLPLSAEMLGGIIAIIVAGWFASKMKWQVVLYLGVLFLLTGNLASGFSATAMALIFSRAIAGLGLGFIMMSIRSLVVSLPETNVAIAAFGAGSIAGLNCGAVIGGMLAERLGYSAVFYLAAALILIPFILVHQMMSEYDIATRETSNLSALKKFVNFIGDKKAVVFLLCIFIPYFISGAFLDYFFPLFASGNGLSQGDISRGVLLNGLFIIYLGPILTRLVINKLGNTNGVILSMSIVFCALASFVLFGTVAATFVTLMLLGLAEGFGISMKTTYFLNLRGIRNLEINTGMAYFSVMVNASRMVGPIIYGLALSLGMKMGVGLISLGILALLLVFTFNYQVAPNID
jgi:predicted MFS family arabinose efflux permease/uncharacterized membrane protein